MKAEHLEILVEEPSMEALLRGILPRILNEAATFQIYPHQCKEDLLSKLPARLTGYAKWLPTTWRIIVVVDRDNDDCMTLKRWMEDVCRSTSLLSRTVSPEKPWQVVSRIAIEELEAWYFGDWDAVRAAYPKVKENIPLNASYRNPDGISGGTWEAFERVLQKASYFKSGLRKIEAARRLGPMMDPFHNRSPSFMAFRDVVLEAVASHSLSPVQT